MFQPFNKTKTYQDVIQSRINNEPTYNTNSAGMYRNPYFDLRTQQELAGELDPTATYPNSVFQPTVTESTPEDPYACPIGQAYDPVLGQCVDIVENNDDNDDNQTPELPYRGVGSVYSPEQNAFMNMGLGSEYFGSGPIDPYGDGLGGLFRRFTPMGQLMTYLDTNRLVNAGVLDRADDGTLTFAKGGNLNLVQNNQAFENQMAKDNMMDFAQNVLGKTAEEAQAMADVTTRGDKADDMGDVYAGLAVQQTPNQSQYGGGNTVSYTGNNSGDSSGGRSNAMFTAKTQKFATPTKTYNTDKFKGTGFIGGR